MHDGTEGRSGEKENQLQAYEYPALDDEPGYWTEKWAEFKRLLAKNWRESYVTEVICLTIAIWIFLIIGHYLFGWR